MWDLEPGQEGWALNSRERGSDWDFRRTTGKGERQRGALSGDPLGEGASLKTAVG